jgi:hypothetical protein
VQASFVNLGQIVDEICHAEKLPYGFGGEIRDFGQIWLFASDGVQVIRNWNRIGKIEIIPIY